VGLVKFATNGAVSCKVRMENKVLEKEGQILKKRLEYERKHGKHV